MMINKMPHVRCQICEQRFPISRFTMWGLNERLCKDCEWGVMKMARDEEDEELGLKPTSERTSKKAVPYETLDANMVTLVKALNRYPGVTTLGSCGGHDVITNASQWEAGTWYVKFTLPANQLGWLVLEHLAWAINNDYSKASHKVVFMPKSSPPFLNTPGHCLAFVIEGFEGEDPDELAQFLNKTRQYLSTKLS